MNTPYWLRRSGLFFVILSAWLSGATARAREISVAFVSTEKTAVHEITSKQQLWKSPYGGWVMTTWPYAPQINGTPVFGFTTKDERLVSSIDDRVGVQASPSGKKDPAAEELLNQIKGKREAEADSKTGAPLRQAEATLDLPPGHHVLQPFGIEFSLGTDGILSSKDPRVRVHSGAGRVEVLCYPVTFRMFGGAVSTSGSLSVSCASVSLLEGVEKHITEFESRFASAPVAPGAKEFRRLTLYLPASLPGASYAANGLRFDVTAEGALRVPDRGEVRVVDRELHLTVQPTAQEPPQIERPVGVQWISAKGKVFIASSSKSFESSDSSGAVWVPVGTQAGVEEKPGAPKAQRRTAPPAGRGMMKLGPDSVRLPDADERWPHSSVLWHVSGAHAWSVEAAALQLPDSHEWSCRITPLTKSTPSAPPKLAVRLESEWGEESGGEAEAVASGGETQVYVFKLPFKPGVWRITAVSGDTVWGGRPMGMVRIGSRSPSQSVSLYTDHNRCVVRRGDSLVLHWSWKHRGGPDSAGWPIVLRGMQYESKIGRVEAAFAPKSPDPRAADLEQTQTGSLQLDTRSLAPGTYTVSIDAGSVATYPVRFHVSQREAVSDFELYTHTFGDSKPHGTSPVCRYEGQIPAGPGLEPFLHGGDAGMSAVFATYATDPEGPVLEKFEHPSEEELKMMALARLGMSALPSPPNLLHHEDWNPKHTLPEDLSRMRRRLALFAQPRADVAGFDGLALGWYCSLTGYWEESPPLDGHQKRRNAAAAEWISEQVDYHKKNLLQRDLTGSQLKVQESLANLRATSSVLPNAYHEYLADVRQMLPKASAHCAIPDFWFGNAQSYPPVAYSTLSHRDAVDYTDYCLPPWGNFRAPAFLAMGNTARQKLRCEFFTHNNRSEHFAVAFGAAGRGLDGMSLTSASEDLLNIFKRYGSWFTAHDPLPDVAVYYSRSANQASVVLHDLARMRRPGMLLSPEDVLSGELSRYKVLMLAGISEGEEPAILEAFRHFESKGGVIIKDASSASSLPGRVLDFAYDKTQVHNAWGLAYPDGESEFAHLWENFKKTREQSLVRAFESSPSIPVGTSTPEVVISPLSGKESILCFVINQTPVPLEVKGRWRQMFVLPRVAQLRVDPQWHVRDVLSGVSVQPTASPAGLHIPVDFTRAEGALFLLTRKEPRRMAMRTSRTSPTSIRLHAWLADAKEQPLPDPMPFEVSLYAADGRLIFKKFAALSEDLALEVPVPALASGVSLRLTVRDLLLGSEAQQTCGAAPVGPIADAAAADWVGGQQAVIDFLEKRGGPVTLLLEEGQEAFEPAAEAMAALLRKRGRQAHIARFQPDQVRPLALRWFPLPEDLEVLESLKEPGAFISRVDMSAYLSKADSKTGKRQPVFEDPRCGFREYGPRLRHDSDIVLFGMPDTHRVLAELVPYLRRVPSASLPAKGGFFVHYLWSPLEGGRDGLYVACRDPRGAESAVARMAALQAATVSHGETSNLSGVQVTHGADPVPVEPLVTGKFGSAILNVAFAADQSRLFVTTTAMGDSLFAVTPSGEILKRSSRYLGRQNFWASHNSVLESVDATTVHVGVGDSTYAFSFEKGWEKKIPSPASGLLPPFRTPASASTVLRDFGSGTTFMGGARRLHAVKKGGSEAWFFDDLGARNSTADLLYPRSLFPRAVSADGRVLLAAAFGVKHDVYGTGSFVNASVLGLEIATGKVLWERDGWLLNQGKVLPLGEGFLVFDDAGEAQLIESSRGQTVTRLPAVGGAEWMIPVPESDLLLIVENREFNGEGPAARVFLRPVRGGADRVLPVEGRVTDIRPASDGRSIFCATQRGVTDCYDLNGRRLWRARTPSGGIVRTSPDGKTVFVGARDGVLHWLNAADGNTVRSADFNPFNVTEPAEFVKQLDSAGELPVENSSSVPTPAPEPSYTASLAGGTVQFDSNLVSREQQVRILENQTVDASRRGDAVRVGRVAEDAELSVSVQAGKTYLIELLASVANPGRLTPHTRLEIVVTSKSKGAAPLYTARLPLTGQLVRRRVAFRPGESGPVTLKLRAVEPIQGAAGAVGRQPAGLSYESASPSAAGLIAGEIVVAGMNFGGRNLVFDASAKSVLPQTSAKGQGSQRSRSEPTLSSGNAPQSKPAGSLTCLVMPWTGGDSTVRHEPYVCPQTALRLVDGGISGEETAWTAQARGTQVDHAECRIKLKTPQRLRSIALYEDNADPVADAKGVRERISTRFGVYVHDAHKNKWMPAGVAADNQQLVNIFSCPAGTFDEILYFWAGRNDSRLTDGVVRLAELEVYSADEFSGMLEGGGESLDNLLNDSKPPAGRK